MGGVRSEKGRTAGHFHWCDKFVCNIRYPTGGSYFKLHFIYLFNRRADCSANSPLALFLHIMNFLNHIITSYTKSASSLSNEDFKRNENFWHRCYPHKWERIKKKDFSFFSLEDDKNKLKITCLKTTSVNNIARHLGFKILCHCVTLIKLFSLSEIWFSSHKVGVTIVLAYRMRGWFTWVYTERVPRTVLVCNNYPSMLANLLPSSATDIWWKGSY